MTSPNSPDIRSTARANSPQTGIKQNTRSANRCYTRGFELQPKKAEDELNDWDKIIESSCQNFNIDRKAIPDNCVISERGKLIAVANVFNQWDE